MERLPGVGHLSDCGAMPRGFRGWMEMSLQKAGFRSDELIHLCPNDLIWTSRTVPLFRNIMAAVSQLTYHQWDEEGRPDLHVRNYGGVAGKPLRRMLRMVARGLYNEVDLIRRRWRRRHRAKQRLQRKFLMRTLLLRQRQKEERLVRYKQYCRRRLDRVKQIQETTEGIPAPVTRSRCKNQPQPGASTSTGRAVDPDDVIVISDTEVKEEVIEEDIILSI